jgi:hypothetical protein
MFIDIVQTSVSVSALLKVQFKNMLSVTFSARMVSNSYIKVNY